ncbi:MAG: hypothetical protein M3161_02975 [Actinomycetota bacterium]|nr:hypothetical protein [Actinomycetota bacterium]
MADDNERERRQENETRRGLSRRSLRMSAIGMLLFPVWYPLVEERGLRWPRSDDLLLYGFMIVMGFGFIWYAQRAK